MLEAIELCERIAGPRARLGAQRRGAQGRPPLVDQRPGAVRGRLPRLADGVRRGGHPARDPRAERRAVAGGRLRLSVVIPARNEAETIEATLDEIAENLDRQRDRLRGHRGGRCELRRHRRDRRGGGGAQPARTLPPVALQQRLRVRRAAGLEAFEGDAVAIMMADGSDDPSDLVLYHELLVEGYDCAFGSRFLPGAHDHRLPAPQAGHQPGGQLGHPAAVPPSLQRHDQRLQGLPAGSDRGRPAAALATTSTSPWSCRSRPSCAGYSYAVLPTSWRGRSGGRSKLDLREMGSRYLFIVLLVFLEHHLSRGDYRQRSLAKETTRRRPAGRRGVAALTPLSARLHPPAPWTPTTVAATRPTRAIRPTTHPTRHDTGSYRNSTRWLPCGSVVPRSR